MIAPMSRVEIVCLSSVLSELVDTLQNFGLLHIEEVPTSIGEDLPFLNRVEASGDEREDLLKIEELERALNEITPLLTEEPTRELVEAATPAAAAMSETEWRTKIDAEAGRIRDLTRKRIALQDQNDVLNNYRQILVQVLPALGGAETKLSKGTRALVLAGDVDRALDELEARFQEELGDTYTFLYNRAGADRLVGLVTFPEDKEDTVSSIFSSQGINPVDLRDEAYQDATVGEVISRIEATMEANGNELGDIRGDLEKATADSGAELIALKTVVADRLAQLRLPERFVESQMVTVIQGWIPEDDFAETERAIEEKYEGKAVVTKISTEGVHDSQIPTLLRNHKFFKPFEVVMSLFRPPTYGTLDPTAMVGVSFIFFYGFVLGDVVYGAGVLCVAWLLWKKWGHIEAVRSACMICVYMGVSGIVFGLLYGEYLGNFGERLFHRMDMHLPLLFHRAEEQIQFLILAILIGLVHVPLAMIMGIRQDFRHGHKDHALEKLGLLLGLSSLTVISFGYFDVTPFNTTPAAYLAGGLLVAGVALLFKTMGMMGLIGVMEILSLGSNVLSYARLMALGVMGIAVADLANEMPAEMGLLGVVMAMLVHLANLFLHVAEPTIHSLRLNFVEFLPKFYSPEGKNYDPFRKENVS